MKLLAFTDVHADSTSLKKLALLVRKEKPDLLINLGDFTIFEQNIEQVCAKLAKLHPIQLVIHGNHEDEGIAELMCKRHKWTFLHQKTALVDDVLFIGYGGGGFMTTDAAFVRWTKTIVDKVKKAKKTILITHQPAYGTAVDNKWGQHVGNQSFTDFIKKHNITLALSGHIHETATKSGKLGKTLLCNPGPNGKVFVL